METVSFGTTCTQPGSPWGPSARPSSSVLREKQLRGGEPTGLWLRDRPAPQTTAGLPALESASPRSSVGPVPGREESSWERGLPDDRQ